MGFRGISQIKNKKTEKIKSKDLLKQFFEILEKNEENYINLGSFYFLYDSLYYFIQKN